MNKINWLDWEKDAFEKSKKENKPILLDISAVWCHWCHRLDKDTYENKLVIEFVNKNFVPIRVDTDKRPDINVRYNLGGWPTTAVLNLNGEIISGTMYLPAQEMLNFLANSIKTFQENKSSQEFTNLEPKYNNTDLKKLKENILHIIKGYYDPYFGGFGNGQKFPNHQVIEFLLSIFEDKSAKEMLVKTLNNMADGEIFDKEEGGFYRYSTQQDWSEPHYEKLLDDNSRLLKTYLLAYNLTKIEKFKEVSIKTINFILSNFLDKEGYFYASQDADEEYAKSNLNERKKIKKPFIDKTLFTDFNCYAIDAFFIASKILNEEKYEKIAAKALQFMLNNLVDSEGILHFYDNKSYDSLLLKNNLLLINSLLGSNDSKNLKLAEDLLIKTINNFSDKEKFFDIKKTKDAFGYLKIQRIDPEENSLAVKVLSKMYEKTKNKKYLEIAENTIENIKNYVDPESIFSASFTEAIILYYRLMN